MFLLPSILLGSLVAAIPVLLHMLRRQNSTPVEWGAMQFLLETPLRARRRRSIDNWLLMLVRIGILLLLALALARPLVKGTAFVATTPLDVAVVLDHSLSMGRRGAPDAGGAGTLFDQAVQQTDRLAAMLPASATVSIVLAEHTPKVVTSTPLTLGPVAHDFSTTLQQLHALKPGITDANIPQAVQSAAELLARAPHLHKLILILSDQQRANWSPNRDTAWHAATAAIREPAAMPIYTLPVAPPASTPNLSVGSIAVQPAFLGVHRPAQITATIANTGAADLANIPFQLIVDGRTVATQTLPALPPGRSNTVHFDHYFAEPGSHWVRVHADIVDGLEADNAATAAVTVSPRLPILIVDGQLTPSRNYPAAEFLNLAMQPNDPGLDASTLIAPKTISVADLDSANLADFPIVLLNDVPRLPAATVARLAAYTQKGNGLWIILGPRTQHAFLTDTLAKSPLFPAAAAAPVAAAAPESVAIREPENPALALVTAAQRNALAGASVNRWWPLTIHDPSMHVLLATTSGDPLATDMPLGNSGGRVLVWTTPVSSLSWNNLPVVPNFVPLVNESLFHLAGAQAKVQTHDLDPGQTLLWSGPAATPIQSASLVSPNGALHALQPELRGDAFLLSYKDTFSPGLYELRFTPAAIPQPVYYTVNIDKNELDPATLSPADIDWLTANHYLRDALTPASLHTALNAQVGGAELWWLLAFLVLALLVVEAFITSRLVKQQTDLDPERAGLVDARQHQIGGALR